MPAEATETMASAAARCAEATHGAVSASGFLLEIAGRLRKSAPAAAAALHPDTTATQFRSFLQQTGWSAAHSGYSYNLLKLVWDGNAFRADSSDSLEELEVQNASHSDRRRRSQVFVNFFTHVLGLKRNASMFDRPFAFFLELSDASTCPHPDLYRHLGLPILTSSRGPHDHWTMLVPDVHMLIGHGFAEGGLPTKFTRELWRVYQHRLRPNRDTKSWASKLPHLVYRGACSPTVEPTIMRARAPRARVALAGCQRMLLRGKVCQELVSEGALSAGNETLVNETHIDFGILLPSGSVPSWQASCEPCRRSAVSKEGQHDYKMILNVDGFGMASDASFWKLSSGSAVVWLMRDGIDEPVHTEWYSPLLQPYEHYIPATSRDITRKVRWCLENGDRCEAIALRSKELMRSVITRRTMVEYTSAILKTVHDLFPQAS